MPEPPSLSGAGPGMWRISFAVRPPWRPSSGATWLQVGAVVVPLPPAVEPLGTAASGAEPLPAPEPGEGDDPEEEPTVSRTPPSPPSSELEVEQARRRARGAEAAAQEAENAVEAMAARVRDLQNELRVARGEAERHQTFEDGERTRRAAQQRAHAEQALRRDLARQLAARDRGGDEAREQLAAAEERVRELEIELRDARRRGDEAEQLAAAAAVARQRAERQAEEAASAAELAEPPAEEAEPPAEVAEPLAEEAEPPAPEPAASANRCPEARAHLGGGTEAAAGRVPAKPSTVVLRLAVSGGDPAGAGARRPRRTGAGAAPGAGGPRRRGGGPARPSGAGGGIAGRAAADRTAHLRGRRSAPRRARRPAPGIRARAGGAPGRRAAGRGPGPRAQWSRAAHRGGPPGHRGAAPGACLARHGGRARAWAWAQAWAWNRPNPTRSRRRLRSRSRSPSRRPARRAAPSSPSASTTRVSACERRSPPRARDGQAAPAAAAAGTRIPDDERTGRPWLAPIWSALAQTDPVTAGRLLVELLPAQREAYPERVAYDLVFGEGRGCAQVTVDDGPPAIRHADGPRAREQVDFQVQGSPAAIARMLTAGAFRRRFGRGVARCPRAPRPPGGIALAAGGEARPAWAAPDRGAPRARAGAAAGGVDDRPGVDGARAVRGRLCGVKGAPTLICWSARRPGGGHGRRPAGRIATTIEGPADAAALVLSGERTDQVTITGEDWPLALLRKWIKRAQSG